MRRRKLRNGMGWPGIILVIVALIVVLGPIVWVVRVATRPESEYIGAPAEFFGGFTFDNFAVVWTQGGMASAILNSAIAVLIGATLAVLLASATGYAIARYRFRARGLAIAITSTVLFLPLAALVIPLFEVMLSLKMLNSLIWLGVVYGILFSAWATMFMRSYFMQLPHEVFEAADVDGAGALRQFFSIALPMAKPALATAFILTFFLQWSELLLALLLMPSGDSPTVAVAIAQFSTQFRTGGPQTAAAMILGTLPVLVLFVAGQRWLQSGALSGAVKD